MSLRSLALFAALPVLAAEPSALALMPAAAPAGSFVLDHAPDLDKGIQSFVAQASSGQRDHIAKRLKEVDPLYKSVEISSTTDAVTLAFDGRAPLVLPLNGQEVAWTRESGEVIRVSARPSMSGLLQTYKAADGERTNEFILLPDGRLILSVQVHVVGLAKDLSYKVVYKAVK
jgi:hypothetical protein